ncbi:MAG: DUF971 domain-containing protein [Gammaproteobacteria bacterium]|jgi:DUF971 family protein|nr:DUF971 domain-containing protein [Gammaproteobacteria bacterium]
MSPKAIKLKKSDNLLQLIYAATTYELSAEYLRVMSPSAEVRGHSPDQAQLQVGKRYVKLIGVEAVGHYAIKLIFDDSHDSGIYTWDYLYDLCSNQSQHWQTYLQALDNEQKSRDPHESVVQIMG